jgi:hypothetical protein
MPRTAGNCRWLPPLFSFRNKTRVGESMTPPTAPARQGESFSDFGKLLALTLFLLSSGFKPIEIRWSLLRKSMQVLRRNVNLECEQARKYHLD